jgi:hypothetical protein
MSVVVEQEQKRERKTTREAESPRARFLRLAQPRVKNALKRLDLVGNLGSSGYESTDAEKEKIVNAIFDKCHETKRRLEGKKSKEEFAL